MEWWEEKRGSETRCRGKSLNSDGLGGAECGKKGERGDRDDTTPTGSFLMDDLGWRLSRCARGGTGAGSWEEGLGG